MTEFKEGSYAQIALKRCKIDEEFAQELKYSMPGLYHSIMRKLHPLQVNEYTIRHRPKKLINKPKHENTRTFNLYPDSRTTRKHNTKRQQSPKDN